LGHYKSLKQEKIQEKVVETIGCRNLLPLDKDTLFTNKKKVLKELTKFENDITKFENDVAKFEDDITKFENDVTKYYNDVKSLSKEIIFKQTLEKILNDIENPEGKVSNLFKQCKAILSQMEILF